MVATPFTAWLASSTSNLAAANIRLGHAIVYR
jgi:hypothetical protein